MGKYDIKEITAIIVIYNSSCSDSISYRRLKELGVRTIICDNSTIDYGNQKIVESDGNIYINMGGNKGLSKAYNVALDKITKETKFICLFDDDTDIKKDYFEKAVKYLNTSKANIFLPIVKSQKSIISPCQFKIKRAVEVKNIEEKDIKNISAINSGIIIDVHVFDNYRYNENIFLDYLDHEFMRDMRYQNKSIKIMKDNILEQNFSMETNSLDSSYKRLCILNHDLKEYYRDNFFMYLYQITAFKLILIKRHKSLKFLHLKTSSVCQRD